MEPGFKSGLCGSKTHALGMTLLCLTMTYFDMFFSLRTMQGHQWGFKQGSRKIKCMSWKVLSTVWKCTGGRQLAMGRQFRALLMAYVSFGSKVSGQFSLTPFLGGSVEFFSELEYQSWTFFCWISIYYFYRSIYSWIVVTYKGLEGMEPDCSL